METKQQERFLLKKGTEFVELTNSGTKSEKAFKDIEVTLIQKKFGQTYFRLNHKICRMLILIILSLNYSFFAFASNINNEKAVLAIIGEAENQGRKGMFYVACGIRNRGTLKGVYGLNSKRVKEQLYSSQTRKQAEEVWKESEFSESCNDLKEATLWENIKAFGKPNWDFSKLTKTLEYKDHVFFKESR